MIPRRKIWRGSLEGLVLSREYDMYKSPSVNQQLRFLFPHRYEL